MGILDLLFPKECLGCKRYGFYLCSDCISKQPFVKERCIICEKPSIDGFTHSRCYTKHAIDRTISFWEYSGLVRKAIISLKYKFAQTLGDELSTYTSNRLSYLEPTLKGSTFILIPIPMHWHKKNWRGFNQVEEIGRQIAVNLQMQYRQNILVRTKNSQAQAHLSMEERATNIQNVFSVDALPRDTNSIYILFDDVYTTGATLREAGKVLKKAGAKKVWALTIAR